MKIVEDLTIDMKQLDLDNKIKKEVLNSFEIISLIDQTYIIVMAKHKEKVKNVINRISCSKGSPIGGFTYDTQSDSYYVECVDYFHLGYVSASFFIKIKELNNWKIRIPIPENILKKYLTTLQKKELKNFKNHFKSDLYEIQYIQMINPN